ncbi:MAG TPA: HAD family phosphatase [Candidatus Saccharimonadales bacterium]|nr:HAD family phosphatase [Candidatus Saccharimonadales bacterium]
MVKAFLFDWGGVMSDGGRGGELDARLAQKLNISPAEAWDLIRPSWLQYSRGRMSEEEFWANVEQKYGKPLSAEQRDIWNTWQHMKVVPEMSIFVSRLRKAGYQVGLLSNTIPNTAEEIRSHGGYDDFDFLVLSCEVGFGKPDPEIYKLAMENLAEIAPEEIVFIDDLEHNLVPARELGMQTILAKNSTQIMADIETLLTD